MTNPTFKIIVIDDNVSIQKDFKKILLKDKTELEDMNQFKQIENQLFEEEYRDTNLPNFVIDTASQGQEGVNKIAKAIEIGEPYALAFVDIRMPPGWDGVETVKHIWELDKNIQIVICTAYSDYSWDETIKELGISDSLLILKKPFDDTAVQQLACALTKKWELMIQNKDYITTLEEKVVMRTKALEEQATHDALTGLPNRILLTKRIHEAIAEANQSKKLFGVLFIDLDRFKVINDSFSHEFGDELLKQVAIRLKSQIRDEDTLARLGGDEFVIVITNQENADNITNICNKLVAAMSQPFQILTRDVTVTASIGACIYPNDANSIEGLLRNADFAMYYAKESGANQFKSYSPEINERFADRLQDESELSRAILQHEFLLYYQPQLDLKTNQLIAIEALLRWQHPVKGIIMPEDFIPLAEETGLIITIGEWVLRTACLQAKTWQNAGLPHVRMAVNVAIKQLQQYDFVSLIKNVLNDTNLEPKYLEIELTENLPLYGKDLAKLVSDLRSLGVHISLDDFGTGCSNLDYLRELPIDRIKIDQSYVHNFDLHREDNIIIKAIIEIAKSLDLNVLAEGVENEKQLKFLKDQQCEAVQGYYFSEPVTAEQMGVMLKEGLYSLHKDS